jgi:mRNA interferase HicA
MKAAELRRFLKKHGCSFENHRGGSGHITVRRGSRKTVMPVHGSHQELGPKLLSKILKDLGLKL